MRWDGQSTGPDDNAFGWGLSFSGREYFGKKHYFRWMASYGNGWGSNIVATVGTTSSAIITPDGKLETMPAWNLGTGVALNISPVLVANINTGWFGLDPSDYRSEDKIKLGCSGHVNLIWSPYKSVNMGAEFMTLYRENGNGESGVGNRLQMMIKYLFLLTLLFYYKMNTLKILQKPIKIVVFIVLLLSVNAVYAQQFNTDNYLTMPHGTGTFVLTTGERNATMYLSRPEIALQKKKRIELAAYGTCPSFPTSQDY